MSLPKDTHVLTPRTYKYEVKGMVNPLHGKRDFTNVMKLRILRWEIILDSLSVLNVFTRGLI